MNLKIKFLPYEKFKSDGFKSFSRDIQNNTIVLIDAKLTPEEEAKLIAETMKKVSDNFSGIELSSLDISMDNKNASGFQKIKNNIIERLVGKHRGVTIIGPAKIVRKIEKNPEELMLYI